VPTAGVRLLALLQRRGISVAGAPAGLTEIINAGDGVSYWASAAKATKELGFSARPLERGLKDVHGGTT
jgi:hypothetical protein